MLRSPQDERDDHEQGDDTPDRAYPGGDRLRRFVAQSTREPDDGGQ